MQATGSTQKMSYIFGTKNKFYNSIIVLNCEMVHDSK